ncbi:GPCR kinase [Tanacetum coccineum]
MACSLPHTDSEVEALVQKLIYEDKGRQNAILYLALQFENSCTTKDDLRNAYEKCNDISQKSRALIDSFLKECSDKVVEDVGEDDDFKSPAWVSATNYANAFCGTVTGCLGDVDNFLKKEKLEQVVVIVKSCSPNMLGDLNVTLKDLSGTIPETIHRKVIGDGDYKNDISIGAAMILANVSVFTPKPSQHYLNIIMRNVVEVFRKDTIPGSGSG